MSFTRLDFDAGTYATDLKQSVRVGEYMVMPPAIACKPCFQADPWTRLGTMGGSTTTRGELIGVDSELMGLTRRASRCPASQYAPGQGAAALHAPPRCAALPAEDTRLSNPPCNMRGGENGFNRFEYLCRDPQEHALMTFPTMVNNALVVKDNHRACVPKPITPEAVLPRFDAPAPPAVEPSRAAWAPTVAAYPSEWTAVQCGQVPR
jgi:hypothetical protein